MPKNPRRRSSRRDSTTAKWIAAAAIELRPIVACVTVAMTWGPQAWTGSEVEAKAERLGIQRRNAVRRRPRSPRDDDHPAGDVDFVGAERHAALSVSSLIVIVPWDLGGSSVGRFFDHVVASLVEGTSG